MSKLPQAHNENMVVQHLNDEVLIYNLQTNKAVCLNSTSAIVFNNCDGKTTFDELKSKYKFNDDLIYFTLDKLDENNLLDNYRTGEHFAGLSRREVIKRVGMGSLIALPVISGLVAPSAAFAASGGQANGTTCTNPNGSQCQSGICTNTFTAGPTGPANPSGQYCCYTTDRDAPGSFIIQGNTSSDACTGAAAGCCKNQTTFTPTSGGQGNCTCA